MIYLNMINQILTKEKFFVSNIYGAPYLYGLGLNYFNEKVFN